MEVIITLHPSSRVGEIGLVAFSKYKTGFLAAWFFVVRIVAKTPNQCIWTLVHTGWHCFVTGQFWQTSVLFGRFRYDHKKICDTIRYLRHWLDPLVHNGTELHLIGTLAMSWGSGKYNMSFEKIQGSERQVHLEQDHDFVWVKFGGVLSRHKLFVLTKVYRVEVSVLGRVELTVKIVKLRACLL